MQIDVVFKNLDVAMVLTIVVIILTSSIAATSNLEAVQEAADLVHPLPPYARLELLLVQTAIVLIKAVFVMAILIVRMKM